MECNWERSADWEAGVTNLAPKLCRYCNKEIDEGPSAMHDACKKQFEQDMRMLK